MHRASIALPVILITLFLAACSGGEAKPEGWASPVFDAEMTYAFQKKDSLTAIDGAGNVRWTFPDKNKTGQKDIKLEAVYGKPVLLNGTLYFATHGGDLLAVSASNGDLIWRVDIQESVVGDVAIANGRIALGTTEGNLFVRNLLDGAAPAAWPAKGKRLDGPIWAPILTQNGLLYVATMRGHVLAFDLDTSRETWTSQFKADGAIADLALLPDGRLFVPSLDKHVYILDAKSGVQIGESIATSDWAWGLPAVTPSGAIVFSDIGGRVYAVHGPTGATLWTYDTGARVKSSPVIIGNTVLLADRAPTVHFIDANTGQRLNAVLLTNVGSIRATPAVREGVAFFLTTKGHIMKADPALRAVVEERIGRYRQ